MGHVPFKKKGRGGLSFAHLSVKSLFISFAWRGDSPDPPASTALAADYNFWLVVHCCVATLGWGWTLPGFCISGRVPRNDHCTQESSSAHVVFCPCLLLLRTHYDSAGCSVFIRPNWTLKGIHTYALILVCQSYICAFSRSRDGNIWTLLLSNEVAGTGLYTSGTKL